MNPELKPKKLFQRLKNQLAKEEAKTIAASSENDVNALKEKAMANVDEAASIIVKNIL